jgi:hypothetical protein
MPKSNGGFHCHVRDCALGSACSTSLVLVRVCKIF